MTATSRALWLIERHLAAPLTLAAIAAACGVSRLHQARAFGAHTGLPVMHYVRLRSLDEAAERLRTAPRTSLAWP